MRTSAWLSWAAAVLIAGGVPTFSIHGAKTHDGSPPTQMTVNVFRDIARRLKPSVVAIETRGAANPRPIEPEEWFDRILGRHQPRVRRQLGAGVVISSGGDIVTNDHVIADADTIDIHLFGDERKTYRAHVVGRDPVSDSALLRLDDGPRDFAAATLGDSSALEAGDWVMSIGNPFHLDHSVSVGVVSHDTRAFEVEEGRWQRLVQIDGSINPGNSGGPLIDMFGEVVGLNVGTMADAAAGIGFALPINTVKAVLPQLRAGSVVHGDIGVRPRDGRISQDDAAALGLPSAAGVLIRSVEPGSSADRGGLQAGDVILDFTGTRVESAAELMTQVWNAKPGTRARTAVVHNGEIRTLSIDVDRLATSPAREPRPADEPDSLGLTFADTPAPAHRTTGGRLQGAVVQSVADDGVAEHAGVQKGDLVRKINRRAITSVADATQELRQVGPGHTAFLLVWRDGRELLLEMQRD